MKRFLSALALAGTALATILAVPVSATNQVTIGESSDTKTVTVTRSITGESNPVTTRFSYSLTEDADNPAPVGGLEDFYIDFEEVAPQDGVVRVEKELDLSNLSFSKVGDYRIRVQETGSEDSENYPADLTSSYDLLISVRNVLSSLGLATGNLTATLQPQVVDVTTGEKVDELSFTSNAEHTFIFLRKEVSGDMSDTDEYFRFSLQFFDIPYDHEFTVTGQDSVVTYDGERIATSKKVVANVDNYVYLKAGQSLKVGLKDDTNELPIGVRYQFAENGAEDYTTYVDGHEEQFKTSEIKTAGWRAPGDIYSATWTNNTVFTNERNGDVQTGINTAVLPFVGLVALAGLGVGVYLVLARKNR